MKSVLMVAFHFPPYGMSSGVQRTASFSRYLPRYGWEPLVLSASMRAYDVVSSESVNSQTNLTRAFALDTARHLGFAGKYPGFFALPDRWISWLPFAVISGLKLIKKHHPYVIWSTYPIATAHLIGYVLHRLTGLPWIADFRDPMLDEVHPTGNGKRHLYKWIEEKAIKHASVCCFTTPGAMQVYLKNYPSLTAKRCRVLANGYDEADFINLPAEQSLERRQDKKVYLLHSGALYPLERDPSSFFKALVILCEEGSLSSENIEIILRATGHDDYIQKLINQYHLESIVKLLPSISYNDALSEMGEVDGLLLLQAENCNYQIPAKTYEYLRSKKPMFVMTDCQGDTAVFLRSIGIDFIAPLDDTKAIVQQFGRYVKMLLAGSGSFPQNLEIEQFSRERRTLELVSILDELGH